MKAFVTLLITVFLISPIFGESSDLKQMLKGARLVPHIKNGKVVGYKAAEVKKGSKWDKIGLKEGDVIKSINGQSVNSPSQAMELYNELKKDNSIAVKKASDKAE